MNRSERRRQLKAEQVARRRQAVAAKRVEIAKRKNALRQTFMDRHKLRLTFWEKTRVVFALLFAASGGPLYPWLPDELRFTSFRRK